MKQNFSRVERGYGWPAFWKSEGFRNRGVFRRSYLLEKETSFCVYSESVGFVLVEDKKYRFGESIICDPGQVTISIHTGCIESFPSIYIKGEVICSDEGWMVEDYENPPVSAGHNRYYTEVGQNPAQWEYSEKIYEPIKKEKRNKSFFVNQYLLADPDIDQRTLLALRGNNHINTHINTILDYSFFWILGVKAHYEAYGDLEFVRQIYPKMCSLMEFCEQQTDEHGFIYGREKDWIYIDWADNDKEGVLCAEQMLYAASWKVMEEIGKQLGRDVESYKKKYEGLVKNIQKFFGNKEKGAYIDSYSSGRRHVTRHANIFAILFEIADKEKEKKIIENVIMNDDIPAITTPYMFLTGRDEMTESKFQNCFFMIADLLVCFYFQVSFFQLVEDESNKT